MQLAEIKTEIVPAGTEAADNALLELGIDGWSILEDAIAKRAWIVGVFATPAEARRCWTELVPLLQEA
ncbi:MAG TPA: 50S ribosomal protein L11 methyltransferase, partial [Opitutaceae bacterium]|nr:50S ribosomal protein L11 methyltransferase [Opitutaceae bacterium]